MNTITEAPTLSYHVLKFDVFSKILKFFPAYHVGCLFVFLFFFSLQKKNKGQKKKEQNLRTKKKCDVTT